MEAATDVNGGRSSARYHPHPYFLDCLWQGFSLARHKNLQDHLLQEAHLLRLLAHLTNLLQEGHLLQEEHLSPNLAHLLKEAHPLQEAHPLPHLAHLPLQEAHLLPSLAHLLQEAHLYPISPNYHTGAHLTGSYIKPIRFLS